LKYIAYTIYLKTIIIRVQRSHYLHVFLKTSIVILNHYSTHIQFMISLLLKKTFCILLYF